jgi:hypothetical protein
MQITAQSFKSKRAALCSLCVFAGNPNVYDAIAACRCFWQPPLAAHLPFNWRQGLCASDIPRCRPKARYGQQAATCSVNTVQVVYSTRLRTYTDVLTSPRLCSARTALLDVHFYHTVASLWFGMLVSAACAVSWHLRASCMHTSMHVCLAQVSPRIHYSPGHNGYVQSQFHSLSACSMLLNTLQATGTKSMHWGKITRSDTVSFLELLRAAARRCCTCCM